MKTIVVSGERSGIGKTYLAERLLKNLRGWSALKVTVARAGACQSVKNCGLCRTVKDPFEIIRDERVIKQSKKDTARLKAAGAKEVIWLRARPQGLRKGLKKALAQFSKCPGIVIEGTSVLKFLKPDLNFHVYPDSAYVVYRSKDELGKKWDVSLI
ncbi:MAG: hypothetical protein COV72_00565 [Candidatus Omnitrophica bacterium CG11_big_fil_rev_8_21_14_0_20_42_13]|uniref:Molybdopterin-guanine dinucleotide biosynthesis protein B (MobB) domain-containing protein n=1 Tax=Candidatus Ghiorseimicrobium undicola TaxID=1974746 RepID=A0A2H0M2F6_9BACT|nr:MAG: hypothetical protein COV72_00565 [Candidatus Omnitrophica bacterium CG11_big_fil_rev_8_21_14_0_20_42_13]